MTGAEEDFAEDEFEVPAWTCGVCRCQTPVGQLRCRVCRAAVAGAAVPALEEDFFQPSPLRQVLPWMLLCLLAGGLASQLFPDTYAWTSAVAVSGWTGHDRVSRFAQLQGGIAEMQGLLDELRSAVDAKEPVAADWRSRLTRTRTRWSSHGDADRYPELGAIAIDLTAIGQDLASLQVRAAAGLAPDAAVPALDDIQARLGRARNDLSLVN